MKVKSLSIGDIKIQNNIFLAPMAGYTDYAFRHLVLPFGYGLCFTELASAKGIVYGTKGNAELLYKGNDENTAVQLFGSDPYFMREACESELLKDYKIVDINMGCPVPKVYKNGEGSALLLDILKAESVVSACVKSGKIVTVKIRTGQKAGDNVATEFAKMVEGAGGKLITVHGRVREAYYSGEVDYKAIENAKNAVSIPVIANGGIFTKQDAEDMMNKTGADGVMIARGGLANPFLVSELLDKKCDVSLKEFIISHVKLRASVMEDRKSAIEFRKFVPYYFKGKTGVRELKNKLQLAESSKEIIELIEKYL